MKSLAQVRRHRYILNKLCKAKPAQRKKMLAEAPTQLFSVIKTLCKLADQGHMKLGRAKKHQKLVKRVSKSNISGIKGMTKQSGGSFGVILASLVPLIAPLLAKVFKK